MSILDNLGLPGSHERGIRGIPIPKVLGIPKVPYNCVSMCYIFDDLLHNVLRKRIPNIICNSNVWLGIVV